MPRDSRKPSRSPSRPERNGAQRTPAEHSVALLILPEIRLAYTALHGLLESSPRSSSRLVYVYGAAGTGKSHLVRHFLRDLRAQESKINVLHVTASEFAAELAQASQEKEIPEFQERYRATDVLVCEDLQAIRGRSETQQQFVALLDSLSAAGKRVVITATQLPGEIEGLKPRLVDRCRGGTVIGIEPLSKSSRIKLLTHHASSRQIALAEGSIAHLADSSASPRVFLASLTHLDQQARRQRTSITENLVRHYLEHEAAQEDVSMSAITRAVARQFGVRVGEVRGERRAASQVLPRQCAMFLARELTRQPLTAIAEYFGRKNHSTVTHACRRIESMAEESPTLRQQLTRIRGELGTGG